jgi:ribonuclease P protein component
VADAQSFARAVPKGGRVWASDAARFMPDLAAEVDVGAGFGKLARIRRAAEFSSVLASRRGVRSAHFVLNHAPNGLPSARFGLIVGRKVAKAAVLRNLVKRIARESFRILWKQLPPFDLVLRAVAPLRGVERRRLRAEIDDLLLTLAR